MRFPDSLLAAAQGADAIINLVGILFPSGKQTFKAVQDEGARHVAEAARAAGAHSAGACLGDRRDPEARSAYARSKAEGEAAVREVFPDAVILQALHRVRAGGRFLQPLRRARADRARRCR